MPYIHCPDCDAIREMDAAACPECGRCANCGDKVAEGVQNCECGFPDDEKLAKWIETRYGIPAESVEKEKSKWLRRNKLAPIILAGRILLLCFCAFLGVITAVMLLAESNQLIQVVLGVPVFCLLAFFYWVAFLGIGKILLWTARKLTPHGK
jgi:hypothetical protein